MKIKRWCITAEVRATGMRISIAGPYIIKEFAQKQKKAYNAMAYMRKEYRYFHVSAHPYKPNAK